MFKEELALVPHKPGCYLMHNSDDTVIYVGKSKNLKNRLSSYFKASHTGKTAKMVSEVAYFEYIITSTEVEALLLEINLIKKYNPRYNILYRDDKTYPYIELTNEKYPRLLVIRNPRMKKNKNTNIYGPYPNVNAARKTVELINRVYPLRKCQKLPQKECLYYHLGECLGYCLHQVNDDDILKMKQEIISFFNGKTDIVTNKLTEKMEDYANKMQYEKALEYKELLDYIKIVLEKQKVELESNINRDVVGYYYENNYLSMQILFIRGGKLLDRKEDLFPIVDSLEEEITTYLTEFYLKNNIKPQEVLIPRILDSTLLSNSLNLKFIIPQKGDKLKILNLANENAKNHYHEQITLIKNDEKKTLEAIEELGNILNLKNLNRIELFDNSHLFGTFNVSGMVVFINGKPCKNEYRKYKITNDTNDDYNTMREVVYRRYFRVLKDNLVKPDLILVDGGLGQLNVTREVLKELHLDIPTASLKKDNNHKTASLLAFDPVQEVNIDNHSLLFLLLTRMQDEVHNFTISYHKQIRSKGALESILDQIPGIGSKRKQLLLKKYHTITKMQEADIWELKKILPASLAISLKTFLDNYKEENHEQN